VQCAFNCTESRCGRHCQGKECAAQCTEDECGEECRGEECASACSSKTHCGRRCQGTVLSCFLSLVNFALALLLDPTIAGLKPSHTCDLITRFSGVLALTVATVNYATTLKARAALKDAKGMNVARVPWATHQRLGVWVPVVARHAAVKAVPLNAKAIPVPLSAKEPAALSNAWVSNVASGAKGWRVQRPVRGKSAGRTARMLVAGKGATGTSVHRGVSGKSVG
jgi:hypothetical protein